MKKMKIEKEATMMTLTSGALGAKEEIAFGIRKVSKSANPPNGGARFIRKLMNKETLGGRTPTE